MSKSVNQNNNVLGVRIREQRKLSGMTQTQLATKL